MAYTLFYSNGKILTTLPDQVSDKVTTSLTLIGKNVNAYGTDINQNYIKLLENFANATQPISPLIGQLWYDSASQKIKVYTANGEFKPVGNPIISPTQPSTLSIGDLWYDSTAEQLKFKKNSTEIVAIGPLFDASVGKQGWVTENWQTDSSTSATVVGLYSNDRLMGVLSDTAFSVSPSSPNYAFTTTIEVGFNAISTATLETIWNGTAKFAEALLDATTGAPIDSTQFLTDSGPIDLVNPLTVYNEFTVGTTDGANFSEDFQFYVADQSGVTTATIRIGADEDFELKIFNESKGPLFHADNTNARLGIFTQNPEYDVDINGILRVRGDLLVDGASTYIISEDLRVVNREIELAYSLSPSDLLAEGGGINLRGTTDHRLSWFSATGWNSSENINLEKSTSVYSILGVPVLTNNSLGPNIANAPGLTNIGNISTLTAAQLKISQTGIFETTIGLRDGVSSSTIKLGVAGATTLDFSDSLTRGVKFPNQNEYLNTATWETAVASVGFVLDAIGASQNFRVGTTIDVTGEATGPEDPNLDLFVIEILSVMFDPTEPRPNDVPVGTVAKILCTSYNTPEIPGVVSDPINFVPVNVDKAGVQESSTVVQYGLNTYVANTDIPPAPLYIRKCIKRYILSGTGPGNAIWVSYPTTPGGSNTIWEDQPGVPW